jgi:hypothetical protein
MRNYKAIKKPNQLRFGFFYKLKLLIKPKLRNRNNLNIPQLHYSLSESPIFEFFSLNLCVKNSDTEIRREDEDTQRLGGFCK